MSDFFSIIGSSLPPTYSITAVMSTMITDQIVVYVINTNSCAFDLYSNHSTKSMQNLYNTDAFGTPYVLSSQVS